MTAAGDRRVEARAHPNASARWIGDLDTPVALVDVNRLDANLRGMAAVAATAVTASLRPHTKTHKTREVARRQLDLGAAGLTVAKLGEAEVMVEAGFDDLYIAYPLVGEAKYRRLLPLLDRAKIRFNVESIPAAKDASAFFTPTPKRWASVSRWTAPAGPAS